MYIKGLDKDMKGTGYGYGMQFVVGEEYKIELNGRPLVLCTDTVFHFCDSLEKVHNFYKCYPKWKNRFFEIEVLGEIVEDECKCGSNHIKILREICGEELNVLRGTTNGNVGLFNSGQDNSGQDNSGNRNSGHSNSGDGNSGDGNSGHSNSGDGNSGHGNSGHGNSGNRNSGHSNSGNHNSGYCNSGNRNSGLLNSCNYSNGVFCSVEPKINIFNMPTDMTMTEFQHSKYYSAMHSSVFAMTEMTDNGLKPYTYFEACARWWAEMDDENKAIIIDMPNFDSEIFKAITGIEINCEEG